MLLYASQLKETVPDFVQLERLRQKIAFLPVVLGLSEIWLSWWIERALPPSCVSSEIFL